jgi:hypothetical protein
MAALSPEKVYLTAAALLAVASAAVCGTFSWRQMTAPRAQVAALDLPDTPYVATVTEAEVVKTDTWASPLAQTRGRDWIYDTFTPPEIFYNPRTKNFTVKPPTAISEDGVVEEPFGLELVSVRPEPFRLQLIGYVGTDRSLRGTFENLQTGEVFLASAGYRVAKLGLLIQSFDVRYVEVKVQNSMSTRQRVATAVVREEKTGRDLTLTHRERTFTGGLSAFVAKAGESAAREVRAGESFTLGDVTYRVDKIALTPPTVEITKEAPSLAQPDRRTLSPRESDEVNTSPDAPAAPSSQ